MLLVALHLKLLLQRSLLTNSYKHTPIFPCSHSKLLNMSDSFSSLLSSTPNSHAAPKITTISSIVQPFCICTHCNHCNHLLTFNHHLSHVAEEGTSNKGLNVQPQQSSRWSPTPLQLLILEELYRKGMKTPSAEQIQQIATQLRQFGKIEGKNVFYWFQNHKARERQKRRRREMKETASSTTEGLKETGCGGVKETKKWASTSNCSEHAEESQSGTALDIGAEKGSNISTGWVQIEEREIQVLRKEIAERHAKCQNMEMPCFSPFTTMPTTTSSVANAIRNTQVYQKRGSFNYYYNNNEEEKNAHQQQHNPRTLDLFPLNKDGQDDICLVAANVANSMDTSEQFFEFLPLRN